MRVTQLGIALLLSAAMASVVRSQTVTPTFLLAPIQSSDPGPLNASAPFNPSQIQQAYGISSLPSNAQGAGQTIAIVDAYNYPNALTTLNTFSSMYGLPQFNGSGQPTFTQLNQTGGTNLPGTDPAGPGKDNWEYEEALDIEYAHATAPLANIILYESANNSLGNLNQAVTTAKNNGAVSVVSMSWGTDEFGGETGYDSTYTTPLGRLLLNQGVTFVASTGDNGAPAGYPAYSPNVVAVGGTSLTLNNNNSYQSESAWSDGGGGVSTQEPKPSYQSSVPLLTGTSNRAAPDVSFDADPDTGVRVYDTYNSYYRGIGGTSLSAPCWAGLIADADELRDAAGYGTLDGFSETLPALYSLPSTDFNDITTGNNGYPALPGYDLATGLGTPIANKLVPDLAAYQTTPEPSTAALLGIAGMIATGRVLGRRLRRLKTEN